MSTLDQLLKASAPAKTSASQGSSSSTSAPKSLDSIIAASKPTQASIKAVEAAQAPAVDTGYVAPHLVMGHLEGTGVSTKAYDAVQTALHTPTKPQNPIKTIVETFNHAVEEVQRQSDIFTNPNSSLLQKGVAVPETVLQAINVLFSPVTAALNASAGIPVVGVLADGVNRLFSAVGGGAGGMASDIIQNLPITQSAKDTLDPLAQEIAGLAAQAALGKAGGKTLSEIGTKSKELVTNIRDAVKTVAETHDYVVPELPKGIDELIKASGPKKLDVQHLPSDYTGGGIYEPYTAPSKLPVIETGPKAEGSTLPVIDAGTSRLTRTTEPVVSPFQQSGGTILAEPLPSVRTPRVLTPKGEGERALSTLAAKVDALAVEKGLTKSLGDLPEYNKVNLAEQAAMATDLIKKSPEIAKQIAMGERLPPPKMLAESVFVAVEDAAIKAGDVATLQDLASRSNLSLQATAMGQRIRALGERNPESPVTIMRTVQAAREANVEAKSGVALPKAKAATVAEIKGEIRKAAPKKETWEGFIKSLECGY